MSKAPTERHGKLLRPSEFRDSSSTSSKTKVIGCGHTDETIPHSTTNDKLDIKVKEPAKKGFMSLIPKMNLNFEKVVEQNPRIHDLREKLNEITKKQKGVDKQTKGLINGITQQLIDDKGVDESGPYSLLFDLQPDSSTSSKECPETHSWRTVKEDLREAKQHIINKSTSCLRSADRLPNVLHFDDKPSKEFEYSCENEFNFPAKHIFNTHSRSDLCLQLKSHTPNRPLETNQSPMENSRANDENSLDDSLGILTPDQMDDMCYLENTFSPTVEGLPVFCDNKESKISPDNGDTPSTDKTESNSAASTIQNDGFEHKNIEKSAPETLCDSIEEHRQTENAEQQVLITPFANSVCVSVNQTPKISVSVLNSKDNFIEKEEIAFVKEDVLVEEEFMPSIHSSILEPASSIAESTVNLEIPLDCKHDNRGVINRIEQTPSPEDLPLDASDINGEISSYSQFSVSTLHDSQTYSDSKNDYPKSMETSKVSNSFITSITSITSLDGYQGDGEMSRPVSRGADHSIGNREDVLEMDWQNVPVTRRADPMTDSDFFTESDADGLDDTMQRGDRRAQVIDGALYGGKNGNGNQPLIVNRNDDSCMESSGVYTDFENHRSSPVFLHAIDDNSPEGSTPSIRSECSQKNNRTDESVYFTPEILPKPESLHTDEKPSGNTSKRNSVNSEKDIRCNEKKEEKRSFTLKKYKMPKRDVPSKLKSMLANRKTEVDTTCQSSLKTVKKIERRDNFSKNSLELKSDCKTKSFKDIKSKVDSSFSLQRSQTACSVNRLTSKSTNTNTKPKSRHLRMRMELGSAAGSGKSSLHSSQSDISALSTPLGKHPTTRFPLLRNGKKREGVPAPATPRPAPPPTPPTIVKKPATNGVVQKLSASPVSVRGRTLAPPPSPRKTPHRAAPAQRPNTLPTTKEPPRVTAALGPRGKRVQTPQATRTPLPAPLPATLPAPLPAPLEPAPKEQSEALAHATKGVEALGVLVQYLVFRLDALNGGAWKAEAERWRGVAAAERTSAARAGRDRQQRAQKDLDTIAECLSKISELEMEVSTKEEATARLQATHIKEVSALASDIKNLKETIESLKREVSESRARLHAHSEIERTLRAQLDAARAEFQAVTQRRDVTDAAMHRADVSTDMSGAPSRKCDAACDPVHCELEECELRLGANEELSTDASELAAEVRSLRAVVELKQAEMASLRDARTELEVERERRAAAERDARSARHAAEELRERAAARQREADRLKDDNRRLRDAAARDRDHATRLAALNEELRYKLRQKSQVVSLLAGGGYMERRARTLSSESARSVTPPPSPPSPASSPAPSPPTPPAPAVKGVVEKHDSVSWVLEIEETPEEVASRLARKSSFRNGASPSGVKRRGGGSPGGGSPAPASPAPNASKLFRPGDLDFPPAPPPLKESAGEAIYIYDDRQY